MAKGQKRSNKEIRKPKATKPAADVVTSSFLSKGTQVTPGSSKKKS